MPHKLASPAEVDAFILRFITERLAAFGEDADAAGLYNYYVQRAQRQARGTADYDIAIAAFLQRSLPPEREVLHVGIGIGTLASLLFARGRRVVGVEADRRRQAAAQALRDAVLAEWPGSGGSYRMVAGFYPEVLAREPELVGRGHVLVMTNAIYTQTERERAALLEGFGQVADVIIDLGSFGRKRACEAEQEELSREIEAHGLVAGADVHVGLSSRVRHFRVRAAG